MAITKSSGKGYSLYNGVKLPDIDSVASSYSTEYPFWVLQHDVRSDADYFTLSIYSRKAYGLSSFSGNRVFGLDSDGDAPALVFRLGFTPSDVYPAWTQLTKYSNWNLSVESINEHPDSVVIWSNFDLFFYNATSEDIYSSASYPIPLDGYNVIEWDGDPTGLETFDMGDGAFLYRIADILSHDQISNSWYKNSSYSAAKKISDAALDNELLVVEQDDGVMVLDGSSNPLILSLGGLTASSVGCSPGLFFTNLGDGYSEMLAYPAPVHPVTTSSGDGKTLYNQFVLPNLPSRDETALPHAAVIEMLDGTYNVFYTSVQATHWSDTSVDPPWPSHFIFSGGDYIQYTCDGETYTLVGSGTWDSEVRFQYRQYGIWANYDVLRVNGGTLYSVVESVPLDGYNLVQWNGNYNGIDTVILDTVESGSTSITTVGANIGYYGGIEIFDDAIIMSWVNMDCEAGIVHLSSDIMTEVGPNVYMVPESACFYVLEDGIAVDNEGESITFPTKGFYVPKMSAATLVSRVYLFAYKAPKPEYSIYLEKSEPEIVYGPSFAKRVVKAYIGDENNLARLCYTAGLKWAKYECEWYEETEYELVSIRSGVTDWYDNDKLYGVSSELRIVDGQIVGTGTAKYGDSLDGYYDGHAELYGPQANDDGTATRYAYTEYGVKETVVDEYWKVYDEIGEVYAPEGEYPDADKGYTYLDTFWYNGDQYTRMRDAEGNSYCYIMR